MVFVDENNNKWGRKPKLSNENRPTNKNPKFFANKKANWTFSQALALFKHPGGMQRREKISRIQCQILRQKHYQIRHQKHRSLKKATFLVASGEIRIPWKKPHWFRCFKGFVSENIPWHHHRSFRDWKTYVKPSIRVPQILSRLEKYVKPSIRVPQILLRLKKLRETINSGLSDVFKTRKISEAIDSGSSDPSKTEKITWNH